MATELPETPDPSAPSSQTDAAHQSMWRVWTVMLLIAPFLLLALSCAAVFMIVARAGGDQSVIPRELGRWFPYIAMVNHTILFAVAIWLAQGDGLSFQELGWRRPDSWPVELAIGAAAGAAIFATQTYLAEPVIYAIRDLMSTGSLRFKSTPSLSINIESLIAGTLFAGVVEETVYRGYIQRQLTARHGAWLGVCITTLGFTVGLHWGFGPWGLIVVFINGLLLAMLFQWRRCLWSCALAHAVTNALVVVF